MRFLFIIILSLSVTLGVAAQELSYNEALFHTGDEPEWATTNFDDSGWQTISIGKTWDSQGIPADTRFAWYRLHVNLPDSILKNSDMREVVIFDLGMIDDCDKTFFNGKQIGGIGLFPGEVGEVENTFDLPRKYVVKASDVNWNGDNVIAVRCYSGGAPGGMFSGPVKVSVPTLVDAVKIEFNQCDDGLEVSFIPEFGVKVGGMAVISLTDYETDMKVNELRKKINLSGKKAQSFKIPYDIKRRNIVQVEFTEAKSGNYIEKRHVPQYILTPDAPDSPRFNTTSIYGARPGSPIHFKFGVSGIRPMEITSDDIPKGLVINPDNGALSGSLLEPGDYTFTVKAKNECGEANQQFTVKVGNLIGLTPPMGWNSWNCWGLSVSQDKVISSAKALIDKGLAEYGYNYINIDDGWEAARRNEDGTIGVNSKFPDMKGLGDWLHSNGLKFGIYSSPGDLTCGKYIGSLGHELQDAESYNSWGVDYLKYDWCGYSTKHETEIDNETTASYIRPYMLMQECLRKQPRDIFYSLCQYGMADVWEWGRHIDANSWRTTYDISDRWESVYDIGFCQQAPLHPYAQPGGWNDPDMLVVGKVGWSSNLRDSRLTVDEQYSHISLWALLAANMMVGCDLAQLDDFTVALLCNNEVNAINQDILARQAKRDINEGDLQIWSRPLADGCVAIGIFNLGDGDMNVDFNEYMDQLELNGDISIRDVWKQVNISSDNTNFKVPSHGVKLLKVKK